MSRTTQHVRRVLLPCVALAAFAALTAGAAAQVTSAQQSAIRSSCRSDFMSKCSGVTPGGKDALMCLQEHVASLSGGCQTAVRATMPAEPAKMAAPPAAAPAPAAAAEPSAPPPAAAEKPATIVSAPPPRAKPAKRPIPHPATAAVAPPPAAPAPPPPVAAAPPGEGMVPGGMLVEKACARYIIMHCRGIGFGTGPKVACLVNYVHSGNNVGPRCRAALTITGQLR